MADNFSEDEGDLLIVDCHSLTSNLQTFFDFFKRNIFLLLFTYLHILWYMWYLFNVLSEFDVLISYQSLVFLLVSTAHHLREVHQGPSHVVTLGLFMHILVLDLVGSRITKMSQFCLHTLRRKT